MKFHDVLNPIRKPNAWDAYRRWNRPSICRCRCAPSFHRYAEARRTPTLYAVSSYDDDISGCHYCLYGTRSRPDGSGVYCGMIQAALGEQIAQCRHRGMHDACMVHYLVSGVSSQRCCDTQQQRASWFRYIIASVSPFLHSPRRRLRLARIVELIVHAESTNAAYVCPALLKGEETTI